MYKYLLIPFFALLILVSGCKDDDEPIIVDRRMSYDGANNTSPFLPAGDFEAAAHFPLSVIQEAQGRDLESVQYYVYNPPREGFIVIYAADGTNTPGQELYEANVSGEMIANQWNTHRLTTPFPIDNQGIWISFNFLQDGQQQTIGCDAGPGVSNGDWLYDDSDGAWRTFRSRTSESINWNIRGVLSN